ncbi:MAG: PAS domain S-box protein, partial [Chloroflexota bacterium]
MAETEESKYHDEIKVLNGLLAVQNVIYVFHSSEKVAEFSSAAIKLVPGISFCSYCLFGHSSPYGDRNESADLLAAALSGITDYKPDKSITIPSGENLKVFNLQSRRYFFGYVLVAASDPDMFEKFHPAISNHLNIVAINLENQLQNNLLLENERFLENEVEKRTKQLREEISQHLQSQVELRETQERYRELADTLPVGIFECDLKGEIIYSNKISQDWFGYTEADIAAGVSIYDCLTSENHEKARNNVRVIAETGMPSDSEYTARRKNGSVFYINISSFPIYKKGQLAGLRGTILDITERKNAEIILRKSEIHFRTLFEKAHEGIIYISLEGKVIRVNDAFTLILGFSAEDLKKEKLSKRHMKFVDHKDYGKLMSVLKGEEINFEMCHPHKDGHPVMLDVNASMVEIENEKLIIALVRDITSRKTTELALQQKTDDLENLVGISHALISTLEFDALLQAVVENAVKLHNLESGALYLTRDKELYLHATAPPLPPGIPDEVRLARIKDHPRIRKALKTGNLVTLGDSSAEKLSPAEKEIVDVRHLISCIYVPILIQNRSIGILILATTGKQKIFTEDEIRIYKMLSTQVGLVIENAMLFRERRKSEESLLKFRLGIERSPEAVFITDPAGTITYINPAFTKIYGYSAEEAIGSTPRILKSGSYPDKTYIDFWNTLLAKQVIEGELVNKTKDGQLITIEGVNNPIVNEDGTIIGFLGIHHDISLRKSREEALRFSEERFRKAFMTNPDSVNINRLADGIYVDINFGFTSLTGYTREEVIGRSSFEINIWDNINDRAKLVKGLKESGIVQNLEAKFRFKDGTVKTGLMSASVIVFNNELHILSITRDIEEIKRTQDALKESEERFKQVTETAEEWIWEVDSKGLY